MVAVHNHSAWCDAGHCVPWCCLLRVLSFDTEDMGTLVGCFGVLPIHCTGIDHNGDRISFDDANRCDSIQPITDLNQLNSKASISRIEGDQFALKNYVELTRGRSSKKFVYRP